MPGWHKNLQSVDFITFAPCAVDLKPGNVLACLSNLCAMNVGEAEVGPTGRYKDEL